MKNIFKSSGDYVEYLLNLKIKNYIKNNNLKQYEILYSKKNEVTISSNSQNPNFAGKEPYYGFSRQISTQTMSRLLNRKIKYTDEIVETIAENMNSTYSNLIWNVVGDAEGIDYFSYQIFLPQFLFKVFCDAFISEKYNSDIVKLLIDYVPFSEYIVKKRLRLLAFSNTTSRKEFIEDSEFQNIIFAAVQRLILKLEIESQRVYSMSFSKYYSFYFGTKQDTLRNLSKTIDHFFELIKEDFFDLLTPNDGRSYGWIAYNLLEDEVHKNLFEYQINRGSDLLTDKIDDNDVYFKNKKEITIDTLNYVERLAKFQKVFDELESKKVEVYINVDVDDHLI